MVGVLTWEPMRHIILFAMSVFSLVACDALEESLQGQAAPLKEPELPNCSRVLTCCTNLNGQRLVPSSIKDACMAIAEPTDVVISEYQSSRETIRGNTATSAETKVELEAELRTRSQGTLEPACRCLLEETIGRLSLNNVLSPADCEVVPSSGALPEGKQCSDVTGAVTDPK
jgi:hypothetical protein